MLEATRNLRWTGTFRLTASLRAYCRSVTNCALMPFSLCIRMNDENDGAASVNTTATTATTISNSISVKPALRFIVTVPSTCRRRGSSPTN